MSNYRLLPFKVDASVDDELTQLQADGWFTLSISEPFTSYLWSDSGDNAITIIFKQSQ